jgi:hypothetical protein
MMDDRITIIEGPTPIFEDSREGWALGLHEGPILFDTAFTRLRTFNGPALVERCHRQWSKQELIYLHYRNDIGMEEKVPIVAARAVETEDGNVLLLWVRREVDLQLDDDNDDDLLDEDNDPDEFPGG